MANSLGVTAGVGGMGAAMVTVVNWALTGHPVPLPTEVSASMAYMFGMVGHSVAVVFSAYLNKITAPKDPAQ